MSDDGRSEHCGRLDPHPPHEWLGHATEIRRIVRDCPGQVVTEGAAPCVECGAPVAACHCYERRVEKWEPSW